MTPIWLIFSWRPGKFPCYKMPGTIITPALKLLATEVGTFQDVRKAALKYVPEFSPVVIMMVVREGTKYLSLLDEEEIAKGEL